MATPRQIIDNVLDSLERPDFLSKAEKGFASALKSCHGISRFQRDLKTKIVVSPSYSAANQQTTIPIPGGMREIESFNFWKTYTTFPSDETLHGIKFKNSLTNITLQDYYGFKEQYTYFLRGTDLILSGLDNSIAAISVNALYWPTFVYDVGAQDYITDSWIAVEYSKILEAQLFLDLSRKQSSDAIKTVAIQEYQDKYNEFLSIYARETICLP